jgi:6-phosphogluconolactonase (cycloisomerase 2 family)
VSLGLAGRDGDVLVVVNKGDQEPGQTTGSLPNYTSFNIRGNGKLVPTGSTIQAPPGSSPCQALISPDGRHVFGTNLFAHPFPPPPGFPPFVPPFASELVSLNIDRNGRLSQAPGSPQGFPIPGAPPFILGLGAHPTQHILYTGFVVANALGVYTYDDDGATHFAGALPLSGAAVCWIDISDDGKLLYAANSATDSIDVVSLADPLHPVELQNLDLQGPKGPLGFPAPVLFNTTPFQLTLSPDEDFLYVLNHEVTPDDTFPAGNAVHILRVRDDGTLAEQLPTLVLPQSAVPAGAHPLGILAL